ncbi:MAG: hypothetical protein GY827_01110 [Cytophagales bacterium]|nr:hypothetical protein [Cytophagales bacterium]
MKKQHWLYLGLGAIALCLAGFFLFSGKDKRIIEHDRKFDKYISAYTHGLISKKSPIRIVFQKKVVEIGAVDSEVDNNFLSFSPSLDGKLTWKNTRTLEFTPNNVLNGDEPYIGTLEMDKIFKEKLPDSVQTFEFQFRAIPQTYEVLVNKVYTLDENTMIWQRIEGNLTTSDAESVEDLNKIFTATCDGKTFPIKWTEEDENYYSFRIDSVERKEQERQVKIAWKGINSNITGSKDVKIPSLGEFSFNYVYTYNRPTQTIALEFTDPLNRNQNLDGLIKLSDNTDFEYEIDGNQIKIFPKKRVSSSVEVSVAAGIENAIGKKSQEEFNTYASFSSIKPQVRIEGKGTIIPQSKTIPFLFETANLRAVDVRVIKIAEQNIHQFLQVNSLSSSSELKRVGSVVLEKRIDLDKNTDLDLGNWNKHILDLKTLIDTEPGAIYEIALGFRPSYSLYTCDDTTTITTKRSMLSIKEDSWNRPGYYYDYYYEGNYYDRSNPCKAAYYGSSRVKKKNVLASSLGIIVKKSTEQEIYVAVTDLNTTEPVSNTVVEIYDYQQGLMTSTTTDANGMASFKLEKSPFLLIAKRGKERGYLRLHDGNALSLSMFDVSGERPHEGIKGFIYGERGVWRPGDNIYTTFILEDKLQKLPKHHPVTFELFDPQGQLIKTETQNRSVHGFYHLLIKTGIDDPTGNYVLKANVGGATFTKVLKVETIKPNRLKILLDVPTGYLSANGQQNAQLSATWLHGAIAKNLDAKVDMTLSPTKTKFDGITGYIFDDAFKKYNGRNEVVFEDKLNEEGKANISLDIKNTQNAAGMLLAQFTTKVFEEGGNFSIDQTSVPFHPYETYFGVFDPSPNKTEELMVNETHDFKIISVNQEGKPVANQNVEVELYKISWRWWWDNDDEDFSSYYSRNHREMKIRKSLQTNEKGEANWNIKFDEDYWGRYLVRVCGENGHCSSRIIYIKWPSWYNKHNPNAPSGATMLSFTTDKQEYSLGEDVTISIPTPAEGHALVSIENGSKVLEQHWVKTEKGNTNFSFKTTKEMTPNAYVHISLLQPHEQTANDLPIRMYGVMPIFVKDKDTYLNPVLDMPDVLSPESETTINISEKDGKAMTYTIAVVDEGLLDLTKFKTPDAWASFYKKQALGIKTWDMYADVMNANSEKIKSLLSIGGDGYFDEEGEKDKKRANRFKPMVKFIGPFHLEAGASRQHTFMMPNYVGSVKTMVVVGDKNTGAYGKTEKITPVKKPLMILGTLPRVLGPEEEVKLPVTVFAMDKNIKDVKVSIESNDLFILQDEATKNIHFDEEGDQVVTFSLKMSPKIGVGKVKIYAEGNGIEATYEVELDVRVPNPRVVDVSQKVLENTETWTQAYSPIGMEGTNKTTLEVSAVPPINLGKRLSYLIHYPYGCVEQTTSSVFPQLFLNTLLELPKEQQKEIEENIGAGIERLQKFQVAGGGLSYWPNGYEANEWGTNYAGHFIIEAKKAGYHVPQHFYDKWISFQKKRAKLWSMTTYSYSKTTQAYRLYLLALANNAEMGAMNRLNKDNDLPTIAKWYLAAAYHLVGQTDVAKTLTTGLSTDIPDYQELSYTYGSTTRDQAIILQSLSVMDQRKAAFGVAEQISQKLSESSRWMSTQTTAYALVAMAKYVGAGKDSKSFSFEYTIDGKTESVTSTSPIAQIEIPNTGNITVKKNQGSNVLYTRIIQEGIPLKGDATDASNNLKLDLVYRDVNGNKINPASIEQGTDFIVEVAVYNPTGRSYKEMALTQIFPSGWEIHNARLFKQKFAKPSAKATYQDIRDDRVNTFFDLAPNQEKVFRILLNASYEGKFYLPTIYSEAMYDKKINARRHGMWVEVVR